MQVLTGLVKVVVVVIPMLLVSSQEVLCCVWLCVVAMRQLSFPDNHWGLNTFCSSAAAVGAAATASPSRVQQVQS